MKLTTEDLTGNSIEVQRLRQQILRQAKMPWSLIVEGERGVGKRRVGMILLESFPQDPEKKWVVDATEDPIPALPDPKGFRDGGGFLLVEQIDDSSRAFQSFFWKWLREVGDDAPAFRIVCTSNQPLGALVAGKRFRADLYLRLRRNTLEVPALRHRKEDISFLLREFLTEAKEQSGEAEKQFTAEAIDWIFEFSWPGNIAQFRDEVLRAFVGCTGKIIPRSALRPDYTKDPQEDFHSLVRESLPLSQRIEDYERQEILNTLDHFHGYKDKAAQALGIDRRTLQRKLRRWKRQNLILTTTA